MKLLITFALLLSPFFVLSQSNYHKGSVTDNNGQIITGYINVREWDQNPKYIEFKNNLDDKQSSKFFAATTKSFEIDSSYKYISYKLRVSMNHTSLPDLPIGKDTSVITDDFFLKQVTTGEYVTLYSYSDNIKTRFFIQEKGNLPTELLFERYYDESKTVVHTSNQFAGELSRLILKYTSNSALLAKTERINYDVYDIQDIVNIINNVKTIKKSVSHNRLYVGARIVNTSLTFSVSGDLTNYNKEVVYSPKLSFGIDIFNNPDVQSLIYRTDLSVGYITATFSGRNYDNTIHTFILKQYIVAITPQVIWNVYNKKDFKFYIDGGLSFTYNNYPKNDFTSKDNVLGVTDYGPYELSPAILYFPLQAGIIINKRIELLISATVGKSTSTNDNSIKLTSQVYDVGINYLFK